MAANSQAKVYDRDGYEVLECRKGDQYLNDMLRTRVSIFKFILSYYCVNLVIVCLQLIHLNIYMSFSLPLVFLANKFIRLSVLFTLVVPNNKIT